MAKDSRDAIVSVRISDEDHVRLREAAVQRGTSVSELVRSVVLKEVTQPPAPVTTVTSAAAVDQPRTDHGIYWTSSPDAMVVGATITINT